MGALIWLTAWSWST